MHWLWTLLNTPKLQLTPLQEIALTLAGVACIVLVVLGIGCVYYAISGKK